MTDVTDLTDFSHLSPLYTPPPLFRLFGKQGGGGIAYSKFLQKSVTSVTSGIGAGFICQYICHIRHLRGFQSSDKEHVLVLLGPEAYAMEPRPVLVVGMLDPLQTELVLQEVKQEPGETPQRDGLATRRINPGAVIGVEP